MKTKQNMSGWFVKTMGVIAVSVWAGSAAWASVLDLGPRLWLDAADTTTIVDTTTAGRVDQWSDKSGGNRNATQSIAANKPKTGVATLNGNNLLTFDAIPQELVNTAPTVNGDSDRTVMYVSTSHGTVSTDVVFDLGWLAIANQAWGITDTTIYGFGGANDIESLPSFGNRGLAVPQIMTVTYDNAGAGDIDRYTDGTAISSNTTRPNAAYATGNGYKVGDWAANDRPLSNGSTYFGNVAEILAFNRVLNGAEHIIANNYLAAKWDLTIANDGYAGDTAGNGQYDRNVWGVGRVDSANQLLSGSTGNGLQLSVPALGDGQYVLAGSKVVANSYTTDDVTVGRRMERVWYVDQTGSPTSAFTLTFDFSEAGLAVPTDWSRFVLLYAADNAFETSTAYFTALSSTSSLVGDQVSFTLNGASLLDGYYTLQVVGVPEPSTMLLLLTGCGLWGWKRAAKR